MPPKQSSPPKAKTPRSTAKKPTTASPKAPNIPKRRLSFGKSLDGQELFPDGTEDRPIDPETSTRSVARLFGEIAESKPDATALFNLGWMYLHGVGGVGKDEDRAYSYLFAAGELNHPLALYHMGLLQLSVDPSAVPATRASKSASSPRKSRAHSPPKASSPSPISPGKSAKKTTKRFGGPEFGLKSLEAAANLGCAMAAFELGVFYAPSAEDERRKAELAAQKAEKEPTPSKEPRSAPVSPRNRGAQKPVSRQPSHTAKVAAAEAAPKATPGTTIFDKNGEMSLKWFNRAKELGSEITGPRIEAVEAFEEQKKVKASTVAPAAAN